MTSMTSYLTESTFLAHLWALILSGVLFGAEIILKWIPRSKPYIEKIPNNILRKIEYTGVVFAIFYAGMSAWSDDQAHFKLSAVNFDPQTAIRTIKDDKYQATESDHILIVRKIKDDVPTEIFLPPNPRSGASIEIKNGNYDTDLSRITIQGNGRSIDGRPSLDIMMSGQEIGFWFDGEEWDAH